MESTKWNLWRKAHIKASCLQWDKAFTISEIPILNYAKAHTLTHIPPHTLHLCIIKTREIKGLKYILKVFLTFKLVYNVWKDKKKHTEKVF